MGIRQYAIFLLLFGVVYFFQSATLPLLDAMTLENQQPFGQVREMGAQLATLFLFFLARKASDSIWE